MHYTCIHCIGFRSSSTFFFSLTRRLLLVITRHDRKRPQKEETSSNARACRRKPQDRSLRRALKVSLRAGLRLSWSGLVWPGLSKVSTQRELSSFSSKPAVLYLVLTRLSSHVALQHRHHIPIIDAKKLLEMRSTSYWVPWHYYHLAPSYLPQIEPRKAKAYAKQKSGNLVGTRKTTNNKTTLTPKTPQALESGQRTLCSLASSSRAAFTMTTT